MQRTRLTLLPVALSLFALLSFSHSAQAVSISPVKFELSANPGDEISNVIRIYNDGTETVNVRINLENFSPSGEGGQVVIDEATPDTGYSIKSWVTLEENTFTLEPRTSRTVGFTMTVPVNAEPGGHYGSILASIAPGAAGGGVGVAQRIGALLLVNVSGEIVEKMYVAEFSAPKFIEYGPVNLTLRFKNDGSVHLKPRGFVTLTNMFGKDAGTFDIPQSNILPQSVRKFDFPWGVKYMYGKYTASVTAIYGSANESLTAVATFWVIPWKFILVVILVLILVIVLLFRGRNRIALAVRVLKHGDISR